MGREVRRVPPNWTHPKTERRHGCIENQPMFDTHIDDALAAWLADFDRVRAGDWKEYEDCYQEEANALAAWLKENNPPDPAYHRPWRDDEATWFQVWETVSEGTPLTPPFETREELIEHLVAHGDEWDQDRGRRGWTRAAAESFVAAGWAPSMIVVNSAGKTPKIFEARDGVPTP